MRNNREKQMTHNDDDDVKEENLMVNHRVSGLVSLNVEVTDQEFIKMLVKEKESIFGADNYMDSDGTIWERPYGQFKNIRVGQADDEGKLHYEALETVIEMVEARSKNN